MKESRLKVIVKNMLKGIGFRAKKFFPYGNAGEPDIEAYQAPVLWGIELKRGDSFASIVKGWTQIQRVKALEVINAGGAYCLLGTGKKRTFAYWFDASCFKRPLMGAPIKLDDLNYIDGVDYISTADWVNDFQRRHLIVADKIKKGVI
jgi:hypothetical protein